MVCVFCGSNELVSPTIRDKLYNVIEHLIDKGYTTFYCGDSGAFDRTVIDILGKFKVKYPHISNIIVLAYRTDSRISQFDCYTQKGQAVTIYPFEQSPMAKYAIVHRNKWLVRHADIVVSYALTSWGGAHKTTQYALKANKPVLYLDQWQLQD